jgi:septal ring factor EnvC (AmiA/AmiB activator)
MSDLRSNIGRIKELKVLELQDKGFSSRQIAKLAHVSLRDVTKFIHRISNKKKSPSSTSIHDEIILEYRVNNLRHEVRDLELQRQNLKNEVKDLCTQKYHIQIQLRARQSELDSVKRNLEYERFSKEILNDIYIEGE